MSAKRVSALLVASVGNMGIGFAGWQGWGYGFAEIFTAAFLEGDDTAGESQKQCSMAEARRKGRFWILAE
jgi:hypothetical protein